MNPGRLPGAAATVGAALWLWGASDTTKFEPGPAGLPTFEVVRAPIPASIDDALPTFVLRSLREATECVAVAVEREWPEKDPLSPGWRPAGPERLLSAGEREALVRALLDLRTYVFGNDILGSLLHTMRFTFATPTEPFVVLMGSSSGKMEFRQGDRRVGACVQLWRIPVVARPEGR